MKLISALFCSLMLLSACDTSERSTSESDAVADLETVLSVDLASLTASAVAIAEAAGQDESRRKRAETCTTSLGDCEVCYSYDGNVTSGDFFVAGAATPCGISKESLGEFSYSLDGIGIVGDWTLTGRVPGDYTITASGFREAHIDITTPTGRTASYDAILDISTVAVTVESLEPVSVEATLAYAGFGGHSWNISLSASATAVWGEVTHDGGGSCVLSGTLEQPTLDCAL
jgi:hypothetical protein